MKAQSHFADVNVPPPRFLGLVIMAVLVYCGALCLFVFKGDSIPDWIKVGVSILFLHFVVVYLTYSIVVEMRRLPFSPKSVFKPYWFAAILFGSIALTILSWVGALIMYDLLWFVLAVCISLLMFVTCWMGIRRAVQQLESSDVG